MMIFDLIFPQRCISCGEVIEYGATSSPFCPTCRSEWEYAKIRCHNESFGTAAMEFNRAYVTDEKGGYNIYLAKYIPSRHDSAENRFIYNLKNHGSRKTVNFAASELFSILCEAAPLVCEGGLLHHEAVITWVPRSRRTKLYYGFDHMERCARVLGLKMKLPVEKLLIKRGKALEQKKLSYAQRRKNASSSICLLKGKRVDGRTVVLIDDIITTGASVNAAAALLYKAGASQIITVTLAATAHEDGQKCEIKSDFNFI